MTLVKPAPDAQVREEKQNKRTWPFPHPKHGKRWLILGVIALLFLAFAGKFLLGQAAQVTLDGSFETLNGTVRSISGSKVVGTGNTVTREVTIAVQNPGGLSASQVAAASINGLGSAGNGTFTSSRRARSQPVPAAPPPRSMPLKAALFPRDRHWSPWAVMIWKTGSKMRKTA